MSEWTRTRVPFHLRVSEHTLLTIHRTLAVRNFGLTGGPLEAEPQAILDAQPSSTSGLLLSSFAIEERLPTLSVNGSLIRYVPAQYPRHYIDLTIGFEEYEKKFSPKTRSTFRRKERKFIKASGGRLDWREYRTPEEIGSFYALAREISQHTYQERLLGAGLPTDEAFRERLHASASEDAVRGYLLFLRDKPVAYLYCPIVNGVLHYAYLGYLPDRDIAALSPGTVLLWNVVRALMNEGKHRIFDFTQGGDRRKRDQKSAFSTHHLRCADIYYLRITPINVALVSTQAGIDKSSGLLGDCLERLGLRTKVRSALRRVRGIG